MIFYSSGKIPCSKHLLGVLEYFKLVSLCPQPALWNENHGVTSLEQIFGLDYSCRLNPKPNSKHEVSFKAPLAHTLQPLERQQAESGAVPMSCRDEKRETQFPLEEEDAWGGRQGK